jgi:hypothetical protein
VAFHIVLEERNFPDLAFAIRHRYSLSWIVDRPVGVGVTETALGEPPPAICFILQP